MTDNPVSNLVSLVPSFSLQVIVPAAGIGSRMRADRPKQYLSLQGEFVLDITLRQLLSFPLIDTLWLALHPDDCWWPESAFFHDPRVRTFVGGSERSDTVRHGLNAMRSESRPEDWVLVHDVARPCLRHADLQALLDHLRDDPVGGLLGVPVADTLKRVESGDVIATVDRSSLWRAYTPQMFRFHWLDQALSRAVSEGWSVTDEASAIERLGQRPRMVEGHSDNIKITTPADLQLAEWLLASRLCD